MPFYDYYCEKNGKTIEVHHAIRIRLKTWGEVCAASGIGLGKIPAKTSVIRLVSGVTPTIFKLKGLDKDAPAGDKLIV